MEVEGLGVGVVDGVLVVVLEEPDLEVATTGVDAEEEEIGLGGDLAAPPTGFPL